jgi:two-component system sensor histidine kinase TctE
VLDKPADSFEPFKAAAVQSEIRPLVQALNDHMARLAAYLDRQRRFLDSTAHQMRTPLSVMKTQVGLARRSRDPGETLGVLSEIDASLTAMSRLTSQLLTLGRVEHERAQLAVEKVDLAEVTRDVASHIAPLALDAGVDLAVEADAPCQIAASAILATLTVVRQGGLGVLTVSDTGRGITPADRAKLFQRFQRGQQASSGGSGLGLAIVAEIAEMFGGHAEVIDPPGGKGFAVRLSLPLV